MAKKLPAGTKNNLGETCAVWFFQQKRRLRTEFPAGFSGEASWPFRYFDYKLTIVAMRRGFVKL